MMKTGMHWRMIGRTMKKPGFCLISVQFTNCYWSIMERRKAWKWWQLQKKNEELEEANDSDVPSNGVEE